MLAYFGQISTVKLVMCSLDVSLFE